MAVMEWILGVDEKWEKLGSRDQRRTSRSTLFPRDMVGFTSRMGKGGQGEIDAPVKLLFGPVAGQLDSFLGDKNNATCIVYFVTQPTLVANSELTRSL